MEFAIQAGQPAVLGPGDREVEDVAAAMQVVFPMDTEDAVVVWNGIPIRVSYKYDLSVMIDDLLPMLEALLASPRGSHAVFWGSNTFRSAWQMIWADGGITISSKWESAAGNYEELLNQRGTVELDLSLFLREWKMPLRRVVDAIEQSGVRIADQENLRLLRRVEAAIPGYGRLYS